MIVADTNTILFCYGLEYVRVVAHQRKGKHLYYRVLDKHRKTHLVPHSKVRFLRPMEFLSVSLFYHSIIAPGSLHDQFTSLGKAVVNLKLENAKRVKSGLKRKPLIEVLSAPIK